MADAHLDLASKAAYRRVLALLRSQHVPFVLVGAHAEAMHMGCPVEGDLELFLTPADAEPAILALTAAGFKAAEDDLGGRVVVGYGEQKVTLAWHLPPPLGGDVDPAWLTHASRRPFLDLRVRVAALEELLWLRLARASDLATDGVLDAMIERIDPSFDWARFLARISGLEALLLAHLFLFVHRHPETARRVLPATVVPTLIGRLASNASLPPVHPAAH